MHLVFPLIAASVLLAWDASPDPDVALYRLYVGIQSIQSLRAGNPPLTGYSAQEAQFQVDGLDYGTEYFFCVTAINLAGLESEYSNEVQYLSIPPPPPIVNLWPLPKAPVIIDSGPDAAVELGVKFKSDVPGKILGVRFYKSSLNVGIHVANLWNALGIRLASATFRNETASGWQEVLFTVPVVILADEIYTASYYCPTGHYAFDLDYFNNISVDSGVLHAPRANVVGGNGTFRYALSSQFPDQTWARNTNYWVDVIFTP